MLKKSYIIHNGKQVEVNSKMLLGKKQVRNDFDITTLVITFVIFVSLVLFYNFINPNHLVF